MRRKTGWPVGFKNIRVQYTGGFSTVPYDLRSAATSIVVDMYLNRKRNEQVASSGLIGTQYQQYASADEIASRYERLLAPHRRVSL